jgi:hypothetical protein
MSEAREEAVCVPLQKCVRKHSILWFIKSWVKMLVTSANGLLSTWKAQGVNLFHSKVRLLGVSIGVNETRGRLNPWQQERWKANCLSGGVTIRPPSFCLSTFIASSCFTCTLKAPSGRQHSKSPCTMWHFYQPGNHFQHSASLNQPAVLGCFKSWSIQWDTKCLGLSIKIAFISKYRKQENPS